MSSENGDCLHPCIVWVKAAVALASLLMSGAVKWELFAFIACLNVAIATV